MKTGNKNLITDVKGILVGNSQDETLKSGVTVLSGESRFNAAVTVLGGAPGTRETDLLETDKLVQQVDALVLSGGSVYGLDAAAGVVDSLRLEGKGYGVQDIKVPIVPGAILFDLLNGGNKKWKINPYSSLGKKAYLDRGKSFKLGTVGAGTGATTSNLKGGLGSASVKLDNGINVGALVAVNSFGSSIIPGSKCFWASPFELNEEYATLSQERIKRASSVPVKEVAHKTTNPLQDPKLNPTSRQGSLSSPPRSRRFGSPLIIPASPKVASTSPRARHQAPPSPPENRKFNPSSPQGSKLRPELA